MPLKPPIDPSDGLRTPPSASSACSIAVGIESVAGDVADSNRGNGDSDSARDQKTLRL
jgi:hypothetical protein